ncbi:MAG: hypothetical protein COB36_14895 [Alphaproteobacteria bacterium]|nr:MAG: hypothetical protein COB36_14895 [Alphaproteobacteria bacterium]
MKTARNDPCPCGSGVKYKKCHGQPSAVRPSIRPQDIKAMVESHEAKEALRQSQQGKGRPIISTKFQDYRITAVGNKIHWGKTHKTFIDFLDDYMKQVLGGEWGNSEIAKPLKERHQILQWYDGICRLQKKTMTKPDGEIQEMPATGLVAAYYGLAYNLYLLQHNAEIQEYLVKRLKREDMFYAAYYETYVAAWFILSGFELLLEDEQDSSRTHPEFIAARDGQSFSVEAKTRQAEKEHFDVGNQLYKGLSIEAHYPRVIFIDMNVGIDVDYDKFRDDALAAIQGREPKLKIKGEPAPPAHVFVTNHPNHLALEETRLPKVCLSVGFKIPDFGHGAKFNSYTDAYKARLKYKALEDVQEAIKTYKIPTTFDGEIPEFAYGEADRRFNIGQRYEVSDGLYMTLETGVVIESEKKASLILAGDDGSRNIIMIDLTDAEIAAYKAHPETFFGRITSVSQNTEDPIDLFAFFINGYNDTPREKLLEFMKGSPNIVQLKKLSDRELLYAYAEGVTQSVVSQRNGVGKSVD